MDSFTMEELVTKLNEASRAYYNNKEIMSNKEYDALYDMLIDMEQTEGRALRNSPTQRVGAEVVDILPKFTHTYPALSLDKTKDIAEFQKRFEDGVLASESDNDGVVLMWKEDGSTVQAYYLGGKLRHLTTRGNGEVGSDITHNAWAISGIPLNIPEEGEVVVRGEALISYKDFETINESLPEDQRFKNPRNLAAASISMLDSSEVAKRHVVVKAFNLVKYDPVLVTKSSNDNSPNEGHAGLPMNTFSGRLKALSKLGFDVVEHYVGPVSELSSAVAKMSAQVDSYPYPVDGLVAAMDNYRYAMTLEGTEHHPNIMQGYAFKWSDETADTILREIEWSPSRTGLLNPVAIFDPVELEGTTVQRASLHNLSIMRSMRIHVGNRISVYKANKIIPNVDKNLDYDNESDYDETFLESITCPTCGSKAIINKSNEGIETVYCPNTECPEKMIGKFAHFCERDCMDIQGMSEETIKRLVDAGYIKEYADFFKFEEKQGISYLPGFGPTSWQNMCEASRKARKTTFVKFVTGLGIPGIGKGQAKVLLKYLSDNYDDLCNSTSLLTEEGFAPFKLLLFLSRDDFDFSFIPGIGEVKAKDVSKYLRERFGVGEDTAEWRVYSLLEFEDKRVKTVETSPIAGKSFCITGKLVTFKNRRELVDKIVSFGGKAVDAVSSNTDYLINNDIESTSGKNKKAKELNTPIISEEDFLKLIEN